MLNLNQKQKKDIKKITKQIVENYKPQRIILFGSYAYGRPRINSDIDITIIKETKENMLGRLKKLSYIVKTPMGTDMLVYTPTEWDNEKKRGNFLIKEISEKGKVLYERK